MEVGAKLYRVAMSYGTPRLREGVVVALPTGPLAVLYFDSLWRADEVADHDGRWLAGGPKGVEWFATPAAAAEPLLAAAKAEYQSAVETLAAVTGPRPAAG